MLNLVRTTLFLVVVTLVVQSANAQDKYHVDVREYTWDSVYRTYDIDIRRNTPIDFGKYVRGSRDIPLESLPLGGKMISTLFHEMNLQHSLQRQANAQAKQLEMQAELLRYQLEEAKSQRQQVRPTQADRARAGIRRYRQLKEDMKHKRLSHKRESKESAKQERLIRAPLAIVLNLNNAQTQKAYRSIQAYRTKYKLDRKTAIMRFLTHDCRLPHAKAVSRLKQIQY